MKRNNQTLPLSDNTMMQCNQAEYVIKQHVCQALDQVILNYALSYDCRKSNYGTFLEFNEKIHIYVG
jgi:hypothetical protein